MPLRPGKSYDDDEHRKAVEEIRNAKPRGKNKEIGPFSLLTVRLAYEGHFKREMPPPGDYMNALREVRKAVE